MTSKTSLTTRQKLDADPNLAYFIDACAPITRWRVKGECSVEIEVEIVPDEFIQINFTSPHGE